MWFRGSTIFITECMTIWMKSVLLFHSSESAYRHIRTWSSADFLIGNESKSTQTVSKIARIFHLWITRTGYALLPCTESETVRSAVSTAWNYPIRRSGSLARFEFGVDVRLLEVDEARSFSQSSKIDRKWTARKPELIDKVLTLRKTFTIQKFVWSCHGTVSKNKPLQTNNFFFACALPWRKACYANTIEY